MQHSLEEPDIDPVKKAILKTYRFYGGRHCGFLYEGREENIRRYPIVRTLRGITPPLNGGRLSNKIDLRTSYSTPLVASEEKTRPPSIRTDQRRAGTALYDGRKANTRQEPVGQISAHMCQSYIICTHVPIL